MTCCFYFVRQFGTAELQALEDLMSEQASRRLPPTKYVGSCCHEALKFEQRQLLDTFDGCD